jgi:hypothetical protein
MYELILLVIIKLDDFEEKPLELELIQLEEIKVDKV